MCWRPDDRRRNRRQRTWMRLSRWRTRMRPNKRWHSSRRWHPSSRCSPWMPATVFVDLTKEEEEGNDMWNYR